MKNLTDKQKERWRRWITALRSGEYMQGDGSLYCEGKYCCLGVACELFYKEAGIGKSKSHFRDAWYGDSAAALPFEIRILLGFEDRCGNLSKAFPVEENGKKWMTDILTELNDHGYSFEEIADILEHELHG